MRNDAGRAGHEYPCLRCGRAPGGTLATILDAWQDHQFEVIVSQPILAELERTLANPYFASRLSAQDTEAYPNLVRSSAVVQPVITSVAGTATHPKDDAILATALDGAVDYIVTGDKQLKAIGSFQGIAILSPAEFVGMLGL